MVVSHFSQSVCALSYPYGNYFARSKSLISENSIIIIQKKMSVNIPFLIVFSRCIINLVK